MNEPPAVSRREFVKRSAAITAAAAAAAAHLSINRTAHAAGSDAIRVGLVGCGGRGTGAAVNAIEASPQVRIVALGDVFPDRLDACRRHLASRGEQVPVKDDRCHVGFDAWRAVMDGGDVDMVILATPPHFRPMHFAHAVDRKLHVFMEKPVAVDPTGVRRILAASAKADEQGLSVVAGTQRRHEPSYREAMKLIHAGSLGTIVSARCYWTMGGLWMVEPRPEWSEMEWQLRNWLYFTWLSGDHIVEQHVHNLDVVNWAIGHHPEHALGMGGRQVRTGRHYGHVFDHFAVDYTYPGEVHVLSMCRQTDGCAGRVEEAIQGTEGHVMLRPGSVAFHRESEIEVSFENANPYVEEQRHLMASIRGERPRLNEARSVAESTLTAIMGRMSAYTGQEVSWEQALNSQLDLTPPAYEFIEMPQTEVAVPGRTPLM